MGKQFPSPSLMANHFSLQLFFILAITITNLRLMSTTDTVSSPPSSPPSSPHHSVESPPPPPPPAANIRSQQFSNIIDALIGSGDFSGWVDILASADPLKLPRNATLFIPNNAVLSSLPAITASGLSFDENVIPYHIIPKRLSFSDLRKLRSRTRIQTLVPDKSLLITNNSRSNFTIDNSRIIQPDFYITDTICLHGVADILDYTTYGDGDTHRPIPSSPPMDRKPSTKSPPTGEVPRSDAACLCIEFPIVISVLWAAFAFKFTRNLLMNFRV